MKNDYTEKLKSTLENMDEKTRYLIFGGILLFIFLIDYFLIMGPQLSTLNKITPEIKILKEDMTKTKQDFLRLAQYRIQLNKMTEQVEQMNLKIKTKDDMPFILGEISRMANDNNVKIDQIMPNMDGLETLLEQKDKIYYSLPIVIHAQGSYHNFGRFINNIEQANIFLNVKSFNIIGQKNPRFHSIKLTLSSVIYQDL